MHTTKRVHLAVDCHTSALFPPPGRTLEPLDPSHSIQDFDGPLPHYVDRGRTGSSAVQYSDMPRGLVGLEARRLGGWGGWEQHL